MLSVTVSLQTVILVTRLLFSSFLLLFDLVPIIKSFVLSENWRCAAEQFKVRKEGASADD